MKPLGPRAASSCAVRVQYDVLPPAAAERSEVSTTAQGHLDAAADYRTDILAQLARLHPSATVVQPGPDAEAQTLAALESGAELILYPRLPIDAANGRMGSPRILLREAAGYVPVEIQLHGVTQSHAKKTVRVSTLAAPAELVDRAGATWKADRVIQNAFALAHYWRALEALGFVSGAPRGAVIDRSGDLVWLDLAAPTEKVGWSADPVSLQESYDHEFGFRIEVAAHATARAGDPTSPRRVLPMAVPECERCPWSATCSAELLDDDHISLLPSFKADWFEAFTARGVLRRADLAALDPLTASVVSALTGPMLAKVQSATGETPLAELLDKRPELLVELASLGCTTAGDLHGRLHAETLAFSGTGPGGASFVKHIDTARAIGAGVPHKQRGVATLDLSPAVIEIDVDMESSASSVSENGRVYLWGALPVVRGVVEDYRPFDTYAELTALAEAEVFLRFWTWLAEQRERAAALGGAIRVYYWTNAEIREMRRIVNAAAHPDLPSLDDLNAVIDAEWIDLAVVWDRHVLTGHGRSLKNVGKAIGASWDEGDTGGDFSMLQHGKAVAGDQSAIEWLHRYNGDDVRATYEVRSWLREHFDSLPRIEDWTP
ncbi:hypothetical protein EFK50_05405 [Nocardioides marmoriginsengisoli]|uniref:YprB ribonuclease H-like domain-containing protein n=1 Tax=Nocardioides marmoriginsengisoli TaxID=661483 RepID=A0A3N0CR55_9ACTN|nr:hypothetical protein EFK50_05405 [Nocardioides marmoriginsengisoli]